jgi:ATP-dependent DNA helicase RecG
MIEQAIRQTKPLPDFSRSSAHEVFLTLAGTVQNPAFLRYIERLGEDALASFQTLDFLALDALAHGRELTQEMKSRLPDLMDAGAVESQGRGKGRRSFLSRALYETMGTPGVHTRQQGLDYETNKALLLKHLSSCSTGEAPIKDLEQVLPAQSRASILRMLNELRDEGRIKLHRAARASLWKLIQPITPDAITETITETIPEAIPEAIPEVILKISTGNQ